MWNAYSSIKFSIITQILLTTIHSDKEDSLKKRCGALIFMPPRVKGISTLTRLGLWLCWLLVLSFSHKTRTNQRQTTRWVVAGVPTDGLISTGAKGLGCSNAINVFKGTTLRDVNFGQRTTKVLPHLSDAYAFTPSSHRGRRWTHQKRWLGVLLKVGSTNALCFYALPCFLVNSVYNLFFYFFCEAPLYGANTNPIFLW